MKKKTPSEKRFRMGDIVRFVSIYGYVREGIVQKYDEEGCVVIESISFHNGPTVSLYNVNSKDVELLIPWEEWENLPKWEKGRRMVKRGDLVRWHDKEYVVNEDEDDNGTVNLQHALQGGMFVIAEEVQVLMTASEVRELKEKGGER